MKGIMIRWVVSAVALYLTALLAHSLHIGIALNSIWAAFVAVIVLGIVNALIRPLVIMLTMPLNCLTLGLFTFVVNALMFWLAGAVVPGFEVKSFLAAMFGSIVMGIISGLANHLVAQKE